MKIELIRIGNSRGIRIPKSVIEQCGLGERIELRVEEDRLIIAPERRPRQHWQGAFRAAGPAVHDELMLESTGTSTFDHEGWKW